MCKMTTKTLAAALVLLGGMTAGPSPRIRTFRWRSRIARATLCASAAPRFPITPGFSACLQYYQADISPACRALISGGNSHGRQ